LTYACWLMGLKTISIGTKLLGNATVGVETIPFLLSIENNLTYSFVHTEHHVSSSSMFHAGRFSTILLEHYDTFKQLSAVISHLIAQKAMR
jgi:hypothetical protein